MWACADDRGEAKGADTAWPAALGAGRERDKRPALVVRPRALVLGAALIPLIVGLSQSLEVAGNHPGLAQGPYPSNYLIPFPALGALLVLMILNYLYRRRFGRALLVPQELLAVYTMLTVSLTVGSAMFGAGILQVIGVVHWSALRQGGASPVFDLLSPLLPKRLTVSDPQILYALYNGGAPPWTLVAARLGLLLVLWFLFMLLISLLVYAVAIVFSRQWMRHERLSYPVVQIPLSLVQSGGSLAASRIFWAGLLVPIVLHSVNGATRLFPQVPPLKIVHYADYLTINRPWNSAWPIIFALNLSTIGIGFFVPTDVLFSAWFFVWLWKAALVITNALGYGDPNIYQGAPYVTENSYGSYLALAVFVPWAGRAHLRNVLRSLRVGSLDHPGGGLIWLLAGGAALATMFVRAVVGLSWWAAALFVALFLGFSLGLARLRAQAAPPDPGLTIGQADAAMKVALGPHFLGQTSIVGLSLYINSFTRWGQRNPIGAMTDALRLRSEAAAGWRWVIPLALLVAIPSGLIITLSLYFRHGLAAQAYYWQGASGDWMMDDARSLLTSSQRWRPGPAVGIASGFLITSLLASLRARFLSFPLHYIGFTIAAGYGMHHMWFSVFLVWAIKASLVRWGSLRAYRSAVPFFAGLIIGEAVMQAAWSGINAALGTKFYTCTE